MQSCEIGLKKTVSSSSSSTGFVGFGNATESYTDATVVVTISRVVTSCTTYCPLTALSTLIVVPPSTCVYSPPNTAAIVLCGASSVPKSAAVTASSSGSDLGSFVLLLSMILA